MADHQLYFIYISSFYSVIYYKIHYNQTVSANFSKADEVHC